MTSRDVFVTLQERRAAHLFAPRPAHFAPALGTRLDTCLPAMESLMFEFSEAGRSFHALRLHRSAGLPADEGGRLS